MSSLWDLDLSLAGDHSGAEDVYDSRGKCDAYGNNCGFFIAVEITQFFGKLPLEIEIFARTGEFQDCGACAVLEPGVAFQTVLAAV